MNVTEPSTNEDEISGADTVLLHVVSLLADAGQGEETSLDTVSE